MTYGEEGSSVHDALPVKSRPPVNSTSSWLTEMTNAATSGPNPRWYDPGQDTNEDLHGTDHDFQAIGPALRILQLNVEGLPAAKRTCHHAHANNYTTCLDSYTRD